MNDNDHIKEYIRKESIEKAPAGFTEKVMTRIYLDRVYRAERNVWTRIRIPVIVTSVSCLLIILSVIAGNGSQDALQGTLNSYFQNLKSIFPAVNPGILNGFVIPSVVMYISIGLLVLSLLDMGLYRLFHRHDQKA